jgi:hypothetical protein
MHIYYTLSLEKQLVQVVSPGLKIMAPFCYNVSSEQFSLVMSACLKYQLQVATTLYLSYIISKLFANIK